MTRLNDEKENTGGEDPFMFPSPLSQPKLSMNPILSCRVSHPVSKTPFTRRTPSANSCFHSSPDASLRVSPSGKERICRWPGREGEKGETFHPNSRLRRRGASETTTIIHRKKEFKRTRHFARLEVLTKKRQGPNLPTSGKKFS